MITAVETPKAARLGGIGLRFLAFLLVLSFLFVAANMAMFVYQNTHVSGAATDVAALQLLSQQLANQGNEAVNGNVAAYAEFKETRSKINQTLSTLQDHFGNDISIRGPLAKVVGTWKTIDASASQIQDAESALLGFSKSADSFSLKVPVLQDQLTEVVRRLSSSNAPNAQVTGALREIVGVGRMARGIVQMRAGVSSTPDANQALEKNVEDFSRMLTALRNGDAGLGVTAISSSSALDALKQVQETWDGMRVDLDATLSRANDLFSAKTAAGAITSGAGSMLSDSEALFDAFAVFGSVHDKRLFPNLQYTIIGGAVLVISLIALLYGLYKSRQDEYKNRIDEYKSRQSEQSLRHQEQVQYNERNQQAIMRLLDEISSLGEGDLTVNASVTEDVTGAIADAVNYAVEELRKLVTTINETSMQVEVSTQETQGTALQLAEAANQQAEQITTASDRINQIAVSIDEVSRNSSGSAEVAQRSVLIATEGAGVVRETIRGMDQIREQIQETSKRIKRLGESSQEIGSVVELINDISGQTNILALNAAVQAASAGEAGRGFAVVADEVQRLAERTSDATGRIESLVQTIQADTNEAVNSMEQTTSEVVSGARLAEDAGTALDEIERVSHDLNELIKNISTAAQQQSAAAMDITQTMDVIRRITLQTSKGAGQTAESIGHLTQLASDLRRSVADFKLPG